MDNLEKIIHKVILDIANQRSTFLDRIDSNHLLVEDLRFGSLDIAQLVATLECKLGIDPFTTQITITRIRTVDDLCNAYRNFHSST
ncbi:MAG: acyl carrier protein [Acidobacteriota bacterium]